MASKHLVEDEAIRSAVREFRILPERSEVEPFTGKSLQQTPSFSQLSSQQPVAKLPRSKSTGTLNGLGDDELNVPRKQWRKCKTKREGRSRPKFTRSREESSESDQ